MITLTEKRLRELEGKLAILVAEFDGIKAHKNEEKPKETFPEIKIMQSAILVSQDLVGQNRRDIEKFNLSIQSEIQRIAASVKECLAITAGQQATLDRQHEREKENAANIAYLVGILPKVIHDVSVLEGITRDQEKRIANLQEYAKKSFEFAQSSKADITAVGQELSSWIKTIQDVSKTSFESTDKVRKDLQFLKSDITVNLASLAKEIGDKKIINYDEDIASLRKDLADVLKVVHTFASQSPDQTKIDDKVKTMEKAIAQIYGLLKKYENK